MALRFSSKTPDAVMRSQKWLSEPAHSELATTDVAKLLHCDECALINTTPMNAFIFSLAERTVRKCFLLPFYLEMNGQQWREKCGASAFIRHCRIEVERMGESLD